MLFRIDRPGPPGAPRVVLVHGLVDRCSSFTRVAAVLGDLSITMYDRSGCGRSNHRPGAVPMAQHVKDLVSVVGSEPAVVIGHSFGGVVALAAACSRPDLISAVGAFESPLLWMPWWEPDDKLPEPGSGTESYVRSLVGDAAWTGLRPGRRRMLEAEAEALDGDRRTLQSAPFRMDDLRVPVVAGAAEASPSNLRHGMRHFADVCPYVRYVDVTQPGSDPPPSHNAHVSHPDAFARFVRHCVGVAEAAPAQPEPAHH